MPLCLCLPSEPGVRFQVSPPARPIGSSGNRVASCPAASVLWLCRLALPGLPRAANFRVALNRFRLPRSCIVAASDAVQGCPCSSVSGLPAIPPAGCPAVGFLRRLRITLPWVAPPPALRLRLSTRSRLPRVRIFRPGWRSVWVAPRLPPSGVPVASPRVSPVHPSSGLACGANFRVAPALPLHLRRCRFRLRGLPRACARSALP